MGGSGQPQLTLQFVTDVTSPPVTTSSSRSDAQNPVVSFAKGKLVLHSLLALLLVRSKLVNPPPRRRARRRRG